MQTESYYVKKTKLTDSLVAGKKAKIIKKCWVLNIGWETLSFTNFFCQTHISTFLFTHLYIFATSGIQLLKVFYKSHFKMLQSYVCKCYMLVVFFFFFFSRDKIEDFFWSSSIIGDMFSTQRANYQSFVTSKYRSEREQKSTIFTLNIGVYLKKKN